MAITVLFLMLPLQGTYGVTGKSDFEVPETALNVHPYLGLIEYFGRWENGIIPIGYNHSGARADVSAAEMLQNIKTAFEIIEHVAGIKFEFVGETQKEVLNFDDEFVVMGWEASTESFAARAGPRGTYLIYDRIRLGYYPYTDGRVSFNSSAKSDYDVPLIVHELLHLLGFGHSDNPVSIMTPDRAAINTLQEDDVAGLQSVYGPPDVYRNPREVVQIADGPVAGISVVEDGTGFFIRPANSGVFTDQKPLSVLDSSHSAEDWVIFRTRFSSIPSGTKLTDHFKDPLGNQIVGTPYTLSITSGYMWFYLGSVNTVRKFPGTWQADVTVAGTRVSQGRLIVNSESVKYNKSPSASLRVDHENDLNFFLDLTITDREGDSSIIDWMLPTIGTYYNGPLSTSFWKVPVGIGATQVFGQVRDSIDRDPAVVREGSAYGTGFGAVVSRWVANPAEPGIPTFYADSGILHIPSLDLEGTMITANFKLTALNGIVLKFLEFDPLLKFSGTPAGQYNSSNGTLTLSKLIVYDQGQKFQFNNAVFRILPDSSPLKVELISVKE